MLKVLDGFAREPGEYVRGFNAIGRRSPLDGKGFDGARF